MEYLVCLFYRDGALVHCPFPVSSCHARGREAAPPPSSSLCLLDISKQKKQKKRSLSLYAPSIVPNIESNPSVNSMEKNMIAQNVDPGNDSTASGYTYDEVVAAKAVGCW